MNGSEFGVQGKGQPRKKSVCTPTSGYILLVLLSSSFTSVGLC